MKLIYCPECGQKLMKKQCKDEGMVDYCERCQKFHFPVFSSAISTVLLNPDKTKVLLIKQYGKNNNVLVAGYVNKGEYLEQTVAREVMEETGLTVTSIHYNASEYFEPTETLMNNFIAVADSEQFHLKENEVDRAKWFLLEEAPVAIMQNSLAQRFLLKALEKIRMVKGR